MNENNFIKCPCGDKLPIHDKVSATHAEVVKHGWNRIFTYEGKVKIICGKCYNEVVKCAQRIYELTGDKYVSISHMIHISKKEN